MPCEFDYETLQKTPDVDFSEECNIQISYNDLVYDADISFVNSELTFEFCGNELISGTKVIINNSNYTISNSDMVFNGATDDLPKDFLPLLVYGAFSQLGSVVNFNSYDEDKNCFFTTAVVFEHFTTFELYQNQNNNGVVIKFS